MKKKNLNYLVEGWSSDNASWTQVFCTLIAFGAMFFGITFLLFGWMIIVY